MEKEDDLLKPKNIKEWVKYNIHDILYFGLTISAFLVALHGKPEQINTNESVTKTQIDREIQKQSNTIFLNDSIKQNVR